MSYYAVANGRTPGIYRSWDECKEQVYKFPGPIYKKFSSQSEAEEFIKSKSNASFSCFKTSTAKKANTHSIMKKKYHKSINLSSMKGANDYIIDDKGYTEVYTDGACTLNGRGNSKAGIGIWFFDNCSYNVSQPVMGRATNNMAEIQAVTIAAKQARKAGITKLKISTDSEFLIKCKTQWMPKWQSNGWRTAKGKPVINKAELIEMEEALSPLEVIFNYVRGHQGIYGNEMANKFAIDGKEHYKEK
ncbi:ribonuclease H1 isoform X2 [Phymastichus coffea]|nr:ribonuclease H1 isoform X2 [Phymastichus coffea]XP_058800294.1 ribonuclease H1 isoform X2 [Phymastichus coffea]XP_058800295.1 ribonuclease H1 isoform X2 [Phymastichus coffea]